MNNTEEADDDLPLVPSPCTSVCRMSARTGWCEGCFRTIDEIVGWGAAPEARKREVWNRLIERAQQA